MILRILDQRYFFSIPLFPKEIKKKKDESRGWGVKFLSLCIFFWDFKAFKLSIALVNKVLLDRETISPSSLFRTRLGGP